MIKLYKRVEDVMHYWEAWAEDDEIAVHWGELGSVGDKRSEPRKKGESEAKAIARLAAKPKGQGFKSIPMSKHVEVVVQHRLDNWGNRNDLELRHQVEALMNECLGWTGNGICDGGDIGSGTTNVFLFVVDPALAVKSILEDLKREKLLKNAIVAVSDGEDYKVVWPKDFSGEFSII